MKPIPPVSRIFTLVARAARRIRARLARLGPTKKRGPEQLEFLATLNSPARQGGSKAQSR